MNDVLKNNVYKYNDGTLLGGPDDLPYKGPSGCKHSNSSTEYYMEIS